MNPVLVETSTVLMPCSFSVPPTANTNLPWAKPVFRISFGFRISVLGFDQVRLCLVPIIDFVVGNP